ncbi:acetyl-CoA carboxylase carboxyltransferase subunit alpha [Pelagicoccus sp. SDUM812003]|uniref:acetyl-CoA carboxylase carboxyltransferase subunit alpha n=1 Tax=Pelagicoccus sp. SDUM812003 TaxID=3041267 RepID=UPI00280D62B2|nr:acetyl-CoA carboxylase carboxyltransferase subunit alpha [Pelagicoccus sp. SDUM812003]MDQ8205317.1 acetyl-CoA carboxylase carboxyltransferase subunit alpha [Pelagicoccus sp. SDUM812003]
MDNKYALDFEQPLRGLIDQLDHLHQLSNENNIDLSKEIRAIEKKISSTKKSIYTNLSPWQRVQLARHPQRPYALDYIERVFTGFQELHGDRAFRDDRAIVGGTAYLNGEAVMVIAQHKGRTTREKLAHNFGSPYPEGYRKALRLMKMADKFGLPIITLVDTQGAYPGVASEERHVSEAIAVNLREMATFGCPIVSAVIGEGGSGGALGIAVANKILILENAYYSVISPEGCAAILWKDRAKAPEAAEALKFGANDIHKLGVVDGVIPEPMGGAHNDPDTAAKNLKDAIVAELDQLKKLSPEELIEQRYQRFRNIGVVEEELADGKIVPINEAAS